jgi:hypothetical protein
MRAHTQLPGAIPQLKVPWLSWHNENLSSGKLFRAAFGEWAHATSAYQAPDREVEAPGRVAERALGPDLAYLVAGVTE